MKSMLLISTMKIKAVLTPIIIINTVIFETIVSVCDSIKLHRYHTIHNHVYIREYFILTTTYSISILLPDLVHVVVYS